MASQEVQDAVGERESAADQLAAKIAELEVAEQALERAEVAGNVREVIQQQNVIAALGKIIPRLTAQVAVEAVAEARTEATALAQQLRAQYADALAALAPELEEARVAIATAAGAARACTATWAAASRLRFELGLIEMRFNVDAVPLEALPVAPVMALRAAFEEAIGDSERKSVRQPPPTVVTIASDSPEQIVAKGMAAAAAFVGSYASDLKLSNELVAVFDKAGTPEAPRRVRWTSGDVRGRVAADDDPAWVGNKPSLPAGAFQAALGPASINEPDTPAQIAQRERVRRSNTRKQAATMRLLGEEAAQLKKGPPAGPAKKKNPLDGMR